MHEAFARSPRALLLVDVRPDEGPVIIAGSDSAHAVPGPLSSFITSPEGDGFDRAGLTGAARRAMPAALHDGARVSVQARFLGGGHFVLTLGPDPSPPQDWHANEQLALARGLAEASSARVAAKGSDGSYAYANAAALRALGLSAENVIGRRDDELHGFEESRRRRKLDMQALQHDCTVTSYHCPDWRPVSARRPDGCREVWRTTVFPIRDGTGQVMGTGELSWEVSQQFRAQESSRRSRAEAEEANEVRARFVSRVSHELRTPLHAIVGFAQLLQEEQLPESTHANLHELLHGGRRLSGLVDEILESSRSHAGAQSINAPRAGGEESVQAPGRRVEPGVAPRRPTASAGPDWQLGEITVLTIDDNLANIELVEMILARSPGTRSLRALDGTTGLQTALEAIPDVVLLDLHLPDVDGVEVLRLLRADPRTASTPVLILTADALAARTSPVIAESASGYLTKPFAIEGLIASLRRVVDDGARK